MIHGQFEVNQRMSDDHVAFCPECGKQADRVYTPHTFYFPDCLWHKDGSKQDPSELPTVYGGPGRYFNGTEFE